MDGRRMQKAIGKQPTRSASERSLSPHVGTLNFRASIHGVSASSSSLPPILEPASNSQASARGMGSPRQVSTPDTSGPNTSGLGLASPRPVSSPRPGVHDRAHITLDGLWMMMVAEFRTLSEAVDAAGLGHCEVFDERNTRTLVAKTVGESRADDATASLLRAMQKPGGTLVATRDCLLSTLGSVPPRQRFRDWANTMLLLFSNLVEMGGIFASGARPNGYNSEFWRKPAREWEKTGQFPIDVKAFRESLIMFDVNVNDANMWFDSLTRRDCWPQETLDFGVLVRRIVAQPWLEGDKDLVNRVGVGEALAPDDVAVRLLHAWSDLSAAFLLKAASEKQGVPRPTNGAERISNYSAHRELAHEESRPPPASAPTVEQWTRALRGANKTRLLAETDAKAEASRQVALQREALQLAREQGRIGAYSHSHLVSLFPNLSEYLLISRANFFPQELIVVRYTLAEYGFLGPAIMPTSRRTNFGSHPFVAIVPFGSEMTPIDCHSPRTRATEPHFCAPCNPANRMGTISLRAPCKTDSGGEDGLWAVQLFASEDGRYSMGPVGAALPLRVVPRPPQVPSQPMLTARLGKSLTFSWSDPVDDGGAPVKGHVLGLWKAGPSSAVEFPPDHKCHGEHVWPPFEVAGLHSETEYIARVRCESEGGLSSWSEASQMVSTMSPEPGDLGAPQIGEPVQPDAVTITWAPHDFRVDSYDVQVSPCDGSEPWIIKVAPPPSASTRRSASPPSRKSRELGESPFRTSPRRRTNSINGTSGVWTKVLIDGLLSNTRYRFAVRAVNASGVGPFGEKSVEVRTGPGVPSAPGAPIQSCSEKTSVTLTWNVPVNDGGSPVVRYFISGREDRTFRAPSTGSPRDGKSSMVSPKSPKPLEFSTVDDTPSLVAKRLRGNTRYIFRVYALNSAGLSEPSEESEITCTAATEPDPPTEFRVTNVEEANLELRWNPPANNGGAAIQTYHIEVCHHNGEVPFKFDTDSLGVIVSRLHGNKYYIVKVCAQNAVGKSSFVQLEQRTGAVLPAPPGLPRVLGEPLANSVTLAWSPPSDDGGAEIVGYTLRCYAFGDTNDEDSGEPSFAIDTVVPRTMVEGLVPHGYYRFKVQAINSCGVGLSSKWSQLVMTAPPPPEAPGIPFVISATSQTISVSWEAPCLSDECSDIDKDVAPLEFEVSITRHTAEDDDTPLSPGPPEKAMRVLSTLAQFRGLRMFATYSFRVRCRGRGGWSEWSQSSIPQSTTDEWSKEEIIDFLMQRCGHTLAGVFRNFDRDCDGFISLDNFLEGLDRLGLQQVSQERKFELFGEADEGSRGVITLREFTKCFGQAAATAPRRQAVSSRSRTCLMSVTDEHQALCPAPSSPLQRQRRSPATTSPVPHRVGSGARSAGMRRSNSPPVPRSLSPQVSKATIRRGLSTQALHSTAKANTSKATPVDELRSGTGECATPPSAYEHESGVQLASSAGEAPVSFAPGARAPVERTRTVPRMKSAPGPMQKNRSQRLLLPR